MFYINIKKKIDKHEGWTGKIDKHEDSTEKIDKHKDSTEKIDNHKDELTTSLTKLRMAMQIFDSEGEEVLDISSYPELRGVLKLAKTLKGPEPTGSKERGFRKLAEAVKDLMKMGIEVGESMELSYGVSKEKGEDAMAVDGVRVNRSSTKEEAVKK
ncbi:OLC1v1034009C1 [Oldenlandia corymbosa var. corymbosa]|uniref:OLC1v1034009C1 n=1 Tax=Oldenlandia corymbosa var. corymbosa TaxID=529605 RepID=A0AAV1CQ96_OLDCO|nr:OLC1v1034009C1 [Oldenlandia corymbosa var. corymbosa]